MYYEVHNSEIRFIRHLPQIEYEKKGEKKTPMCPKYHIYELYQIVLLVTIGGFDELYVCSFHKFQKDEPTNIYLYTHIYTLTSARANHLK